MSLRGPASKIADDCHCRFRASPASDRHRTNPSLARVVWTDSLSTRCGKRIDPGSTPEPVRIWMNHLPEWAAIRSPQTVASAFPSALGQGEREDIALAEEIGADVLLVDDEAARMEAGRRLIPVQGTLGVLDLASEHGLLSDLPDAIERLKKTNFRASAKLLDFFLERDAARK